MKKNLWIWAIAALSMTACTSEDAPTQEQIVTENDFESPDGRVVVQLGAESHAAVGISRAPIEGTDITELQDLGIFALNRDEGISDTEMKDWPNTIDNILLMNVKAQGTTNEPLDNGVNTGKRLTLFDPEASSAGKVYYYPIQGSQNYDFYGYQPRVTLEADENSDIYHEYNRITYDATNSKIQVIKDLLGDVDLITGEAGAAATVDEGDIFVTQDINTETGKPQKGVSGNMIDGYNSKYIRKIKYNNWIIDKWNKENDNQLNGKKPFIPNIQFEHRLTRLNFQIITAEAQAGTPVEGIESDNDRLNATELRVSDVKLLNSHALAYLTIGENMPVNYVRITATTEKTDLETGKTILLSPGADLNMIKIEDETTTSIWENNEIKPQNFDEEPYIAAGYLMVPPTDKIENYASKPYKIALTIKAKDSNGIPQTQDIIVDLKDKYGNLLTFEAGKSYNIRIALYALQTVYVNATLTDWDKDTDPVYIPVE